MAPTEAAVEQVFMAQNPDSALKLGKHVVLLLLHWSTLTYKLQNTPHARLNSRWSVMALRTKNKYNDGDETPKPEHQTTARCQPMLSLLPSVMRMLQAV